MRELKFRVWNGMEMIHDVTVGKFGAFYVNPMSKGNGLDEKDSASLTPFNTRYSDGTPVMMFTGLCDKDGIEMYSKDIIEMAGGQRGVIEWCDELACFQMVIHEKGEVFTATIYSHQEGNRNTNRKVIGNAYQNIDLLSPSPKK